MTPEFHWMSILFVIKLQLMSSHTICDYIFSSKQNTFTVIITANISFRFIPLCQQSSPHAGSLTRIQSQSKRVNAPCQLCLLAEVREFAIWLLTRFSENRGQDAAEMVTLPENPSPITVRYARYQSASPASISHTRGFAVRWRYESDYVKATTEWFDASLRWCWETVENPRPAMIDETIPKKSVWNIY